MTDVTVRITGIRELNKAFKRVDADIPKELRVAFLAISKQVVSRASRDIPVKSGAAAGSLTARASQRGASIAFGGSKAEYEPWLDFGGRVGRHRSISRDFKREGRYVYPAIAEERDAIGREALDAVERAARSASFEVRG